jgi:hypothetical protein
VSVKVLNTRFLKSMLRVDKALKEDFTKQARKSINNSADSFVKESHKIGADAI